MRSKPWILGLCLVAAGAGSTAAYAAEGTKFKVYGGFGYVSPLSDSKIRFNTVSDSIKAEKKAGWNLGFELRLAEWMGVEIDYLNATQDVTFGGGVIGETDFSPLTATLNFHLIHTTPVDFYVGPSYSYVNWGDINLNGNGATTVGSNQIGTDSAKGWGASAGIDIGIGAHFAITGGLRYLNVDLKLQGGQSSGVDPLIARLGAAFRF